MITQAAWQGIRRSPWIKAHYERIKNGQKQRTVDRFSKSQPCSRGSR
jgi:hypothetical protein